MQEGSVRYRIAGEVTGKVIDGEAVVIDLSTGIYYSLNTTGSRVWELIEAGLPVSEMAETLSTEFQAPIEKVRTDLEALLQNLVEVHLIEPRNGNDSWTAPHTLVPSTAYAPPELTAYHDMADLLALDPPVPGLMPDPWKDDSADDPGE